LLYSSDIWVFWLKDRKVKAWQSKEGYRENSLFPSSVPSPSIASETEYCPF
jgi:hypothetical protein